MPDLNAGTNSDKQITTHYGILSLLKPVNDIMAERGFEIGDDLLGGVTLSIPLTLKEKLQLSPRDSVGIYMFKVNNNRNASKV